MASAGYRRTQIIVEKGLQFRFARFVILFVFVSSIITGVTIFYTTFMMLGERLADVYPQGRLVSIFRNVHLLSLADMLVILPLIFYGSIVFSHRVAGPLPKIYNALREIGQGNFDIHLTLRKHDELVELVDNINEMAKNLKSRQKP